MADPKMKQRYIDLFDEFTHGTMSRRNFMERLAKLAGGAAAAAALVPILQNNYAEAGTVDENDERLVTEMATYEVDGTTMSGYLARLKGGGKRPGVVVIHENRGLNPHIKDVARRMALEGFLAFAPDALAPVGGTPADEDRAREMIYELDRDATVTRMVAAVPFLAGHPESTGKVGAIGFCWGGGMVNKMAAAGTSLAAGVPYYGRQLLPEEVPKISAPLCLQYAGLDTRINAGIDDFVAALKANNKAYELHIYEGANHAFNNDTNKARYDKEAADLAWGRTVDFLKRYLAK
ncbi:MAG: dienelactone hydrolase family protein [Thermoanaerobaculales bacterium]|nr:dienelactone hydrolase family protein [Thermoanaerobaculales bacterium]